MFDMIKKLQEAQGKMKEIKARLEMVMVEGKSNNGAVKVTANGNRKIMSIDFINETQPQMNDLLKEQTLEAINDALSRADKVNESEMKSAAGSMIPGIGGMFN
jgi:nucleoid-associated protein EbfC